MSETPERIEREMFEIRSRMSPDMTDLRKHIEPQVVAEQVKQTVRQRLRQAVDRVKANLKAKRQEFLDSANRQLSLARKVTPYRGCQERSTPSHPSNYPAHRHRPDGPQSGWWSGRPGVGRPNPSTFTSNPLAGLPAT